MVESPRISDTEWVVMDVLWNASGPLGLTEIIEALPAGASRNQKTINTFLSRLAAKGVVEIAKSGRANLYRAAIPREACVRQESQDFLKRVFQGATAPMMLSLIEDADLTGEEIDQLQKLLDQKKEDKS